MTVTATRIFDFLSDNPVLRVRRHEIESRAFARLRKSIRELIVGLRDERGEDGDIAYLLQQSLSEWASVPLPFASFSVKALESLGPSTNVATLWGAAMQRSYDQACENLAFAQTQISPLRSLVGEIIGDAVRSGSRWHIYCDRRAVDSFRAIADEVGCEIDDRTFLHSLSAYKAAEPFDLMLKIGALRSRGWGSFPPACVNAARYSELVQVTWARFPDEPGFGSDAIVDPWLPTASEGSAGSVRVPQAADGSDARAPGFTTQSVEKLTVVHPDPTELGAAPIDAEGEVDDDPAALSTPRMQSDHGFRRAALVHVGDGLGVLYSPNSQVLLLTPGSPSGDFVSRSAIDDIQIPGPFLIWPEIADVNLGDTLAQPGSHSSRWKAELRRQLDWHPEGLVRQLRAAGVELQDLRGCLDQWARPATNVIHAPQQRRHFAILIEVLAMESREPLADQQSTAPGWWWRAAWEEVRKSRGLAIQDGVQEQEIVDEEMERLIRLRLPEVRASATAGNEFRLTIPPQESLEGSIAFYPIREVERGFLVPDSALKRLINISIAEEWRA